MESGKKYIDKRGWKYQVMGGIGGGIFRARYQKPDHSGMTGWKSVGQLPWRLTFEEAQADLGEREDELKRILEKTKAKAVSPDPQGRFQAFLFLHPKARNKAYNILKRHFKTAAVILNPAMVDLTAGDW